MVRVIDECVLAPWPGDKPAGEDLRALRDWVALRAARPKPEVELHEWTPANPIKTDWATYRDMVETALCTRSKDLELGIFLTEASARVYGFSGLRDGFWTIRGLIANFRDKGLYPRPEEDDPEAQYGKLEWLNDKLSEVIREIPITIRPEPGINYSLNYRDEALRQDGMITAAEFEAAVAAGTTARYEEFAASIDEAVAEFRELEQVVDAAYGDSALSFTSARQSLEDCRSAVQGVLHKRRAAESKGLSAALPGATKTVSKPLAVTPMEAPDSAYSESWKDAERIAKAGDVDRALGLMAALAAGEPNGRVRFQRKLLLADLCLQTGRKRLAKSILEELHQTVETHRLDAWETSEMIGAVWSRLVRCYRDTDAGTADEEKEAEFFLKLSRLDPWQALACGEPAGRT